MTASAPPAPSGQLAKVAAIALGLAVLRIAALVIGGLPLYLDEAQYWFWAQDLAFGYFSKPPLIAWAIAGTTAVCGDGAACVKLASPIAYAIAPLFAYLLGRNLFSERVGLLSGIAFATLPGVAFSGFIISTDPLLLLFWMAGLWAFERALATGRRSYWLALGVALGFGMLAKYAMIYFVAPAVIVTALRPRGARPWGGLGLGLFTGLLILSPNLIWNVQSGFETLRHTAANAGGGAEMGGFGAVGDFLGDQAAILGPVFICVLFAILIRWKTSFATPGERFLGWFSLPILALLIIQAFLSRAHGNWAAVAFPALTVLIVAVLVRLDYRRLLRFALAFHLGAFLVMTAGLAIGQVPFVELSAKTDPFRWVRGWDRLATSVDDMRRDGDRVVITTDRAASAELVYWLRDTDAVIRRWSSAADGAPDDSFALALDINDARGRDAVIVSRRDNLTPAVVAAFETIGPPTRVEMRPYPDPKGTYYLFLGQGFRGREIP